MGIQKIKEILIENGYENRNLKIRGKDIEIPNTYMKDEKEVYILLKYEDINKLINYQTKILWFQNCTNNRIIKYNINIIILYDNSKSDTIDLSNYISFFERDTNICRKIFVNIDDIDSLNVLPFYEENSLDYEEIEKNILAKIESVIANKEIYIKLSERNFNCNDMDKLLFEGGEK